MNTRRVSGSIADQRLTVQILTFLAAGLALGLSGWAVHVATLFVVVVGVATYRSRGTSRFGAVVAVSVAVGASLEEFTALTWHVPTLVGLGAWTMLQPESRSTLGSYTRRSQRSGLRVVFLAVVIVFGSAAVLQQQAEGLLFSSAAIPIPLLLAGLVINAITEEIVWRGVFLDGLTALSSSVVVAAIVSSVSFGVAHYDGFPFGVSGMALAMVFGMLMVGMRRLTSSLRWPIGVHFLVDVVIVEYVLA